MIIVMSHQATESQVSAVVERVKEIGLRPEISRGEDRAVIGVIGGNAYAYREAFSHLPAIQEILQITKPFKLASREFQPRDTVVDVAGVPIGGEDVVVMAGPCSVEGEEMLLKTAIFVAARGAMRARGGETPLVAGGGEQNSYLLSVPLFHATGCHSVLVANTAAGGKLVMMHKWDPERALELIERERVTNFGGVPAMVWQVLDSPDFDKRDTSSVKSISYGGAPAPPELVKRIRQHFPVGLPSNGYGLTETSSVTTMNTGEDYIAKPESVGPPVPVCDVKVMGDDGNELALGQAGELWIKGPNVVRGYWNNPDATAAIFAEGWLHSGDVARLDDEGFVYIVDRAKDMLIRGGENVYSVEVEAALFEHPAVADVAVIGIPHPVLGEEVGAVVQLRTGASATEEELRKHVAQRLAAFKVPVRVWFREDPLPRNPAGKVLKRDLRDELVGDQAPSG